MLSNSKFFCFLSLIIIVFKRPWLNTVYPSWEIHSLLILLNYVEYMSHSTSGIGHEIYGSRLTKTLAVWIFSEIFTGTSIGLFHVYDVNWNLYRQVVIKFFGLKFQENISLYVL
jgi:hypothetical protein